MRKTEDQRFDPEWRDDILDPEAIYHPLILPDETEFDRRGIRIVTRYKKYETVFGKEYEHESRKKITSIIKKSEVANYYSIRDAHGNVLPHDDPFYEFAFPPKAWMTDAAEERCTMFAAAKLARGKILAGGLGLGIYPQFIIFQGLPADSITIVENDPSVFRIVCGFWKNKIPDKFKKKIRVIRGRIEDYLKETEEIFDTIYLDTWDDSDSRFLPYVNYLKSLALMKCAPDGQVQCWTYAMMVDTFVRDAVMYAEKNIELDHFQLDPALDLLWKWLKPNKNEPHEIIEAKAREIALTTVSDLDEYEHERYRCFTPYAMSMSEFHLNMARARKPESLKREAEERERERGEES